MAITKEQIAQTAIAILNRGGIECLTMRSLAKELGIKAASLYWHFAGKREMYGAIAESMCLGYVFPSESDSPVAALRALMRAYRIMLLAVRDSVAVFEESLPNTPQRVELIRAVANALRALGVKPQNMMVVSNLLNNYVLSFAADECRFKSRTREEIEQFTEMLGFDERPALVSELDFDEQFEYGLSLILRGIGGE